VWLGFDLNRMRLENPRLESTRLRVGAIPLSRVRIGAAAVRAGGNKSNVAAAKDKSTRVLEERANRIDIEELEQSPLQVCVHVCVYACKCACN